MSSTHSLIANTTFQEIANGAVSLTISPEIHHTELYIGNNVPSATETNTFVLKCVAGENYLQFDLASGDRLFVKSLGASSKISWIVS